MMSFNMFNRVPCMMLGELKQLKYLALRGNPVQHFTLPQLLDVDQTLNGMRELHSIAGFIV